MKNNYTVTCRNETGEEWTFAIYKLKISCLGLMGVAMDSVVVGPEKEETITWTPQPYVFSATRKNEGGTLSYEVTDKEKCKSACKGESNEIANAWEYNTPDSGKHLTRDTEKRVPSGYYSILNRSSETAWVGIGEDKKPFAFKSVEPGVFAIFSLEKGYYVGLHRDLVTGELMSANACIGPEKLDLDEKTREVTVIAEKDSYAVQIKIVYPDIITKTK